ncbi:MAG: ATP-dependent Clp protease proteolytic subunit [Planctomycetes bacterium]|nr:ATP-dependent Clp protease proteolytic subunit [Planctomycetota bacterium]
MAPREDEETEEKGEGMGGGLSRQLLEARTILISRPIDDRLARNVYAQLVLMENADPSRVITVIVNSPGGSADSGFGIYDMLVFSRCPTRSIVAGLCASAAVPVFLSAPKGQRYSLPNARFLLHQPSTGSMGTASDIEITAREIQRIKSRYNRIVAEATGKPEDRIAADADRDFWLEAEEAVQYGLVDRVIRHRGELD